jgi:hypothetical protein
MNINIGVRLSVQPQGSDLAPDAKAEKFRGLEGMLTTEADPWRGSRGCLSLPLRYWFQHFWRGMG